MKPPRSVWVLLSDDSGPINAALHEYEFANLSLPGSWEVVRYVLPTKPRGRKPRKRRRGNGGGA